jgi:cephalosporin hydroxylase
MKILSKKQFLNLNRKKAKALFKNKTLQQEARNVLIKADRYRWLHQSSWMGEPLLNLPQDMFAIQEIVFKTKPEFIIETGVAWGGSLLFHASLLELIGGKKVIGIDIFMPKDLIQRLKNNAKLYKRIELIKGSSTDCCTIKKIYQEIKSSKKVLVILDSFHTHNHVLKELQLFSPMVGKGYYLICGDTIVEKIPKQLHRKRPWGPGNNPETALKEFFKNNKRFQIDYEFENKILLSCHPGGYLKAIK